MIEHRISIKNKLGLHARSASAFVKVSSAFSSSITVRNKHAEADGKSIMSMMMLQAARGTEIELLIDGEDEEQALAAIVELIDNRFGEDE